jgi:hypothetical protein
MWAGNRKSPAGSSKGTRSTTKTKCEVSLRFDFNFLVIWFMKRYTLLHLCMSLFCLLRVWLFAMGRV